MAKLQVNNKMAQVSLRNRRRRDPRDFQFEPFSVTSFDPLEVTAGSVALNVCVPSEIDAK